MNALSHSIQLRTSSSRTHSDGCNGRVVRMAPAGPAPDRARCNLGGDVLALSTARAARAAESKKFLNLKAASFDPRTETSPDCTSARARSPPRDRRVNVLKFGTSSSNCGGADRFDARRARTAEDGLVLDIQGPLGRTTEKSHAVPGGSDLTETRNTTDFPTLSPLSACMWPRRESARCAGQRPRATACVSRRTASPASSSLVLSVCNRP